MTGTGPGVGDVGDEPSLVAWLCTLVRGDDALMAQLRVVRALRLADWCIGAGAVRTRAWTARFGPASRIDVAVIDDATPDVDVAYVDDEPWTPGRDRALAARLSAALPGVAWEVVHQAHVRAAREAATPCRSVADGLATWPETATAVGVRLHDDDRLSVVAPFGLRDLFDGVLRPNPRCPDATAWARRLQARRWPDRWPALRVLAD